MLLSKKKKLVHIALKIPISDYGSIGKLINFISDEWEKIKAFFENYNMIYPRLINSLKRKFDYVLFQRKGKMENETLENLCNKIVDVVHETFTRKFYFVKILQSKKGHIYLIVRKKKGDLLKRKKTLCIKKYLMFPGVLLNGTVTDMTSWKKIFLQPKIN